MAGRAPAEGIAPDLMVRRPRICCHKADAHRSGVGVDIPRLACPAGARYPERSVRASHAAPLEAVDAVPDGCTARCRVRFPGDSTLCSSVGRATESEIRLSRVRLPPNTWSEKPVNETVARPRRMRGSDGKPLDLDMNQVECVSRPCPSAAAARALSTRGSRPRPVGAALVKSVVPAHREARVLAFRVRCRRCNGTYF